jgi:hypothetical protein
VGFMKSVVAIVYLVISNEMITDESICDSNPSWK